MAKEISTIQRGIRMLKIAPRTPFLWVIVLTLSIVGAMFYSFHTGRSMAEHYAPLTDAAVEIKYEAAIAHLWFEEIISGDPYLDIEDVWEHLDKAVWYAKAMLDGGENQRNTYLPLKEQDLREGIEQTLQGLNAFRRIAEERWLLRSDSGVGSDIDQRFDKTFNDFLVIADKVGVALQQTTKRKLQQFRFLQSVLIIVIIMLGLFVGSVLQRHERRRSRDMLILQDKEENLRTTLNSIGDGVIATDTLGKVTRMNPVAEQLTGWQFKDAKGKSLRSIFPIIDTTTREPIINPIEKVIATGETVFLNNHSTLISKDGTERQIADSAAPIRDNDRILGMVLVFNDVTEQYRLREAAAESAAQVNLLLNSTAEAIYGIDITGQCTFVNRSCLTMLGYDDENELLGKNMHNLIHYKYPDGTPYAVENCHIFQAFREEQGTHIDDEVMWRKDGSSFAVEYWSHPIFKENQCIGTVVTFWDITTRKQAEEMAQRSQKMDALGKLTGGIAHDYNNMLGIIMGYAELLKEKLSDQPQLATYVHEIYQAGERGAKLTKKLLAFTKRKISDAEILDINNLLRDEQHMMERTLTVRINLQLNLADDLWPVWLDRSDFENTIVNLSINAMHAIQGSGQLTIQTGNILIGDIEAKSLKITAGDYVLLNITDTGCGMDAITREKIFDPFFSTKGEYGTGLGLSQVYGFLQRSKGVVKVYSELGQGTKFSLYFPRHIENTATQHIEKEKTLLDSNGTETILLVDDELALLDITRQILEQRGYRVYSAESAKQALIIMEKQPIDLLLSDVIMPEIDGYQLAALVQEKYPDIKIQLASGFSDNRKTDAIDSSLQKELLHKPFSAQVLLRRIRTVLDQ